MDVTPRMKTARTSTGEQRSRKRTIDKLKHRENRAENKTRLQKIEHDLSFLCDTMRELLPQLEQLKHNSASITFNVPQQLTATLETSQPNTAPHAAAHSPLQFQQRLDAEAWCSLAPSALSKAAPSMPSLASILSSPAKHTTGHNHAYPVFPYELPGVEMDIGALAVGNGQRDGVHCYCGRPHRSEAECIERITAAMVSMLTNVFCHPNPPHSLAPRNPSLSDMLLHNTTTSSPIASVLSSVLRQYDVVHTSTLCGIFFLAYRLLRSRFYHSAGSTDVPTIMRPTNAQVTLQHPRYIDFLPFPALRNYLCHNQDNNIGHTMDLYMRSLKFTLPLGRSLMRKVECGNVELHPEFESFASDLRNWDIGAPWSNLFPQLQQFLR